MNEIENEQIKSVVTAIHSIARKTPQLLDMLLSDELLKYSKLDKKEILILIGL